MKMYGSLFNVQRPAIVKHINNIYNDEKLEGNRSVSRKKRILDNFYRI